jgi:molybdopterin guanine dinucleotide-containing S/N-oxide reductase-like protein
MSEKVFTSCTVGGPISVYVKDGKITRVRPLVVEEKDFKPWTIQAGGQKFTPHKKVTLSPVTLTERIKVYSEDRIKYPMKRVDWDPKGNRNQQNRGKSKYVRISWDEALDLVAGELKRVQSTYGPSAVTAITSSHHNWGLVGYKTGPFTRFFNRLGFTFIFDNPDSWEGFHWGAPHAYGFFWRLGCPEQFDLLEDALKNTDMIVFWSNDPDSTHGGYCGQESALWRQWFQKMGKKMIFIDPYCNYTAARMADKWIAPKVGTDAALALGIAYTWFKDNTYDKKYLSSHAIGFEDFKKYVLGKEDGVPKTAKWTEEKTGVPARTITALAREWAAKRTSLSCGLRGGFGGAMRVAYGHEWARFMIFLQAMQGLGKPGVSMWGTTMGGPFNSDVKFQGYADPDGRMSDTAAANKKIVNPVQQRLYRLNFPEAILNPPIEWRGEGFCGKSIEQQLKPYKYPTESEVKLFYRYGGSFMGTMCETSKWLEAYQSPKLETIITQDVWWGSETGYADIILPACTNLEREDLAEFGNAGGYSSHASSGCNWRVIVREQKCIEPLYESKSDYEIFTLLSERLGFKDDFTDGGKTEMDWVKRYFEVSDLPKHISWEEFNKKGYYLIPVPENYKPAYALRWFYEGRTCDTNDYNNPKRGTDKGKELGTYSGKIEFVSQSLTQHLPDDKERPPMPHYIPSWEGPESPIAKKYPLQLMSPHPRFSYHTHYDTHSPWLGEIPGHRILKDGYYYITVRVHPEDADSRGIQDGDIIKMYNDRGGVLGAVQITERVKPGVVHSYCSSIQYDPLEPGKPRSMIKAVV